MVEFTCALLVLSFSSQHVLAARLPEVYNVDSQPLRIDTDTRLDNQTVSLIGDFADDPTFEIYPQTLAPAPKQWFMPDLFKRQSTCVGGKCANIGNNCPCGYNCCTSSTYGYCCTETQLCDPAFYKPGPTQSGAGCLVTSAIVSTVVITTGSTATLFATIQQPVGQASVVTITSVVTISSAATATIVDTVTVASAAARRARHVEANRPARAPTQPQKTPATAKLVTSSKYQTPPVPLVTAGSMSPNEHFELMRKLKRQAVSQARTSTTVTGTTTRYVTTVVTFTSTVTNRATSVIVSTTTITSTTVVNAKATTRITTTVYSAGVRSVGIQTTSVDSQTTSAGGANRNSGANDAGTISPNSDNGGLSTGAKAGIGVGAGLAAILIGLLLAFFLHRRSKQRRLEERARIDTAVSQAIGDHQRGSVVTNEKMSAMASPAPYYSSPAPEGYQQPYRGSGADYTSELGATPVMRHSVPADYAGQPVYGQQGAHYGGYASNTPEMYSPPPNVRHEM